jgi:hypothetical protein
MIFVPDRLAEDAVPREPLLEKWLAGVHAMVDFRSATARHLHRGLEFELSRQVERKVL